MNEYNATIAELPNGGTVTLDWEDAMKVAATRAARNGCRQHVSAHRGVMFVRYYEVHDVGSPVWLGRQRNRQLLRRLRGLRASAA